MRDGEGGDGGGRGGKDGGRAMWQWRCGSGIYEGNLGILYVAVEREEAAAGACGGRGKFPSCRSRTLADPDGARRAHMSCLAALLAWRCWIGDRREGVYERFCGHWDSQHWITIEISAIAPRLIFIE